MSGATQPIPLALTRVGEYDVVRVLGEGAMGIVVAAVHPVIGKRVAIKILKPEAAQHGDAVERFIREARVVNSIEHANIINVFSFGRLDDGRCYFVMEHLDGESLEARVERDGALPIAEALPVLRQVASAIDAAHSHGVIHRDLKPENILLSRVRGGAIVAKVLDFGIAKLASEQTGTTQAGLIMGTPLVMSPEQCLGGAVDHRTDLYAFGVVVYRALTGRYPFEGDSVQSIIFQQIASRPLPVSVDGAPALDDVIARALAKHPGQRFQSAGELVDALEALVATAPSAVAAAPSPPDAAASTLPIALARRHTGADLAPVEVPWEESTGLNSGVGELRRAARDTAELDIVPADGQRRIDSHAGAVTAVAFSPDANLIASASADCTVRLHGVDGRQLAVLSGHSDKVEHVVFSPQGHMLASGGLDGRVRLWSIFESRPVRVLRDHRGPITALCFSPRGDRVVSAGIDATIRVWNVTTGACTTMRGHSESVRALAFCPRTGAIASASDDRTVRTWDDGSGSRRVLNGHKRAVYAVQFSPDGRHLVSAGHDGTVREWTLADGKPRAYEGHRGIVWDVAYSPDGAHIASAGSDGTVRLWPRDGKPAIVLSGHEKRVKRVVFSADGTLLASVGADGTVRIWDLERKSCMSIVSHSTAARSAEFSPDGRTLLTAGGACSIYLTPVTRDEANAVELPVALEPSRSMPIAIVPPPRRVPQRNGGAVPIAAVAAIACAIVAIVIALVAT